MAKGKAARAQSIAASKGKGEAMAVRGLLTMLPDALDCIKAALQGEPSNPAVLRSAQWVVQLGLDGRLVDTPAAETAGLGQLLSLVDV